MMMVQLAAEWVQHPTWLTLLLTKGILVKDSTILLIQEQIHLNNKIQEKILAVTRIKLGLRFLHIETIRDLIPTLIFHFRINIEVL